MVAARTVEQGREFFDPAVLEKTDGFGTRSAKMLLFVGVIPIVSIPVLAMLERIGGQVELSRVRLPESGEVGQVAQDVRVGNGFGDLSVVGGVSAQRRDRPRCGGRVRPCAHGCGGEHRPGADLEQHFATQIGKGAHALGEFHRLARVTAPIGAIEPHAPAERGAGTVVDQNPLWRIEIEPSPHTTRIRRESDPAAPSGRRGWFPASHTGHRRPPVQPPPSPDPAAGPDNTVLAPL